MTQEKHISASPIEPQKYNILLTREGKEIDFDFPPAGPELITRYGYLLPHDERCSPDIITDEAELYAALKPVLGSTFNGDMAYHTRKQVIITLHDTAILGYQRQVIIDPRISNEVALFWEIYLDQRVFPQCGEAEWQKVMSEVIITELKDDNSDRLLAEDIKNKLLEQAHND